jgi:TonB family protein
MQEVSGLRLIARKCMKQIAILVLATALLPGCATNSGGTRMGRASLENSTGSTPSMSSARYDRASGTCSAGSLQLITAAQMKQLVSEWNEAPPGSACTGVKKSLVPESADYPALLQRRRVSGAAHVLLRVDRDGSVHSVHAVCATDQKFAEAAASTARSIAYTPSLCEGKAVRSSFLLPFAYDI